ncbi:carboxypeptidase-like regulatory domain-containing protein [Cellulophaga sp. F20128]|uniref:carboxypeptidase-like regulatory domain-containing protein n=1 Tax=Cellulophaga sp. F20128 TaxID=2926413 RepID=UPI001FF67724|nr:carboxypeptidase-like regulatory domain-containing protein [Cellulophaga sp. F20128]MCK0155697.1 carboxypeptidase-like regulatory domain-containing protein [Cellulophaga sp. F20128]
MYKTTQLIIIFFTITIFHTGHTQTLNASIEDSKTNQPIPYVTVVLSNKKGVITNEEGRFSLSITNSTEKDSLFISCIGYESIATPVLEIKDSIIYMVPKTIELKEVLVSNKNYTAEEIIDLVKDSLDKNYNKDYTKKKIFFRESYHQNLDKTNYTFMKSTIEELNKEFLDSVLRSVPKRDNSYSEILCDLYGNYNRDELKINTLKACRLYDKNSELDITKLEEKFNDIIKKNVKPGSYFKIKSGIFGTKIDAKEMGIADVQKDSIALKKELEERKKREEARKNHYSTWKKNSLSSQFKNLIFMEDSDINVVHKSGRYEFELEDYTYLGDAPVYVLTFEPKRGADYKGKLYVNADDFAIIRIDYENVKNLKNIKLFGISYQENISRGKMIFSKNKANTYDLQFYEKEIGSRAGIDRPLKIIEKNRIVKGKNRQNELYVKLDMAVSNINKYEIVIFDTSPISEAQFVNYTEENKISPIHLNKYDPEFWKGHNIMEPNMAIRDFTAEE